MHRARLILPVLFCTAFSDVGIAQYFNRAVFLGREEEGIRRDFNQNAEYFLNRFSYLQPPWRRSDLNRFGPGMDYAVGSVTSREFTVEARFQYRQPLNELVAIHFNMLQSENQDTRYTRTAAEFEFTLTDDIALFLMGEGVATKGEDDLSLGFYLGNRQDNGLRFSTTLVDAVGSKLVDQSYSKRPIGLMLSGWTGRPGQSQLGFELASQLPLELDEIDLGRTFELERHIGSVTSQLVLHPRDRIVTELEIEYTEKERTPLDPLDPELESLRRNYLAVTSEWWHGEADGSQVSVGVQYRHKNEDGYRPNDPSETLRAKRSEWLGFVRSKIPLRDEWSFEPSLYAGHVDLTERVGTDRNEKYNGFQGKAGVALLYEFTENAEILLNVMMELDRSKFGGGSIQFVTYF